MPGEFCTIHASGSIDEPVGLIDQSAKPEYHVYVHDLSQRIDLEDDVRLEGKSLLRVVLVRTQDWEPAGCI